MDRIEDLRWLVRIIETGSLSAAAREAKTTQPTVSKRQLALEHVGPVLLARFVVDEDLRSGELVELVPGLAAATLPVFAVTLPVRPIPVRIKSFLAFLKRELPGVPGWAVLKS